MNYPQSQQILEEIKKAKNILLMCHKSPDLDSMISCILMSRILTRLNIGSKIYCVDEIPEHFRPLNPDELIEEKTDIGKVNLDTFDLFIALDVNELSRFGFEDSFKMNLPVINIDHHAGTANSIKSVASILNESLSATSEAIYFLAKDWKIDLNHEEMQTVLIAMMNDTNMFSYNSSPKVFRTVAILMEDGANFEEADLFLNRRNPLDQLHYWSEMMANITVDKEHKFAYSAMNYKEFAKYKNILQPTRTVSDMFIRTIDNTNFGIAMVENKKDELNISIRSRDSGFRVLELLKTLGGGGHVNGGGASIKGMKFEEAVNHVLEAARKYARKN
jgi:phosphoesterase RecJ-like protein